METTLQDYPDCPFLLFENWYHKALELDLEEPNYMTLATATTDGRPSARIVLLKGYNENGFYFYTNLTSRKGNELLDNPHVALCLYWQELGKQIRIEGIAQSVTDKLADEYFASRHRESQIGAWASKQSQVMEHDTALTERISNMTEMYQNKPVTRPPFWSGFCVVPHTMEFWQNQPYRLHTRIVYQKQENSTLQDKILWNKQRLYP